MSLWREQVDLVRMAEFSADSRGQVVTLICSPDLAPLITTAMLLCLLVREADLARLLVTSCLTSLLVFRDSREKEAATAGMGTIPEHNNIISKQYSLNPQ